MVVIATLHSETLLTINISGNRRRIKPSLRSQETLKPLFPVLLLILKKLLTNMSVFILYFINFECNLYSSMPYKV